MWSNKPFSMIDAMVKPPVVVVVHSGTGFYRSMGMKEKGSIQQSYPCLHWIVVAKGVRVHCRWKEEAV